VKDTEWVAGGADPETFDLTLTEELAGAFGRSRTTMVLRAKQKENVDTTIGFRIRTAVEIDSVTQETDSENFVIVWHETSSYIGDSTTQTVRVRFRQVGDAAWTLLKQDTELKIKYEGDDDLRTATITVTIPDDAKVACEEKIEFLV